LQYFENHTVVAVVGSSKLPDTLPRAFHSQQRNLGRFVKKSSSCIELQVGWIVASGIGSQSSNWCCSKAHHVVVDECFFFLEERLIGYWSFLLGLWFDIVVFLTVKYHCVYAWPLLHEDFGEWLHQLENVINEPLYAYICHNQILRLEKNEVTHHPIISDCFQVKTALVCEMPMEAYYCSSSKNSNMYVIAAGCQTIWLILRHCRRRLGERRFPFVISDFKSKILLSRLLVG
jgi:hypothetical protein